ncbi:MAG: hypothetical protein IKB34_08245 [Clostridia bacterium]|nr:hypothetical protein [Clostridia bacterium]
MKAWNKWGNSPQGKILLLAVAVLPVSLVLAVSQIILYLLYYDSAVWLYRHGSEGVVLAHYLICFAACFAVAVICVVLRKRGAAFSLPSTDSEGRVERMLRWIGGGIFILGSVMRLVSFFLGVSRFSLPDAVISIMLIFGVFAGFYFFGELDEKTGAANFSTVCGMIGVAVLCIDMFSVYTDKIKPIAADYRVFTALCTASFLLFMVLEIRSRVHDPKPALTVGMLFIACVLCVPTLVGRATLCLFGRIPFGDDLGAIACGLGYSLYLISRLILYISHFARVSESDAGESEG